MSDTLDNERYQLTATVTGKERLTTLVGLCSLEADELEYHRLPKANGHHRHHHSHNSFASKRLVAIIAEIKQSKPGTKLSYEAFQKVCVAHGYAPTTMGPLGTKLVRLGVLSRGPGKGGAFLVEPVT